MGSFFRGVLLLVLFAVVIAAVGSFFMRRNVISELQTQALTSASLVYSQTFPITRLTNFERARVLERLKRLGYQQVNGRPQHAGQFSKNGSNVFVFLRGTTVPAGGNQREQLVRVTLGADSLVQNIYDEKFRQELPNVWLEPEILSLLGSASDRVSTPKRLEEFPPHLVNAVIAIEDERFYSHLGVDPLGILRAAVANARAGHVVQGGSTITQQLAKNLFLTPERSIRRKLSELVSAILIETAFEKQQILEFYLNEVFLGQEGRVAVHGFGEAAQSFFGKDATGLTLSEAATLAGVIKAPTKYSPRLHKDRARKRRDVVLAKMHELKFISDTELHQAKAEALQVQPAQRARRTAPYFVDFVRRELRGYFESEIGKRTSIQIYTGIDPFFQTCAERAVSSGLSEVEKAFPRLKRKGQELQAALVAVTPHNGHVVAWVGGRNYGRNQFDRISLAHRQPGSSFKPFVYLTALDRQLNPYRLARTTSLLSDEPVTFQIPGSGAWSPQNYDHKYRGDVTIRQALANSLNIPTVNLAMKVGIDAVAETAASFGFGKDLPRVPSLALGAGEVTPLEMARAYSALASGGMMSDLLPIVSATLEDDSASLFRPRRTPQRVTSEAAAYVLTDMLRSVVEQGTAQGIRRRGFTRPVAGKTGTSNDTRDSWFVGFTPSLLAVTWVGFDDNQPTGLTGATGALPIWTEFMKCSANFEPELEFIPPPGVVTRHIDKSSGLLATDFCPAGDVVTEVFIEHTEPVTPCPLHAGSVDYFGQRDPEPESWDLPRNKFPPARKQRPWWEQLSPW